MHSDGLATHWDLDRYPGSAGGSRAWSPESSTGTTSEAATT